MDCLRICAGELFLRKASLSFSADLEAFSLVLLEWNWYVRKATMSRIEPTSPEPTLRRLSIITDVPTSLKSSKVDFAKLERLNFEEAVRGSCVANLLGSSRVVTDERWCVSVGESENDEKPSM
mmetsp:Transcript_2861/g.4854  ORF Transcript_2861/g.4854 Transcript_2861/m.4854 type:complete len:123 (-) Transcript_2861:112-480(-)